MGHMGHNQCLVLCVCQANGFEYTRYNRLGVGGECLC